jgi:hypothetical protein
LLKVLRRVRVAEVGLEEAVLHAHISQALTNAGIAHRREYRFGPHCRADFWIHPGVVIEVKKRRPVRADLIEQLTRYAKQPKITRLIVMLERAITVPDTIEGVPVHVISMNAAWGIAV